MTEISEFQPFAKIRKILDWWWIYWIPGNWWWIRSHTVWSTQQRWHYWILHLVPRIAVLAKSLQQVTWIIAVWQVPPAIRSASPIFLIRMTTKRIQVARMVGELQDSFTTWLQVKYVTFEESVLKSLWNLGPTASYDVILIFRRGAFAPKWSFVLYSTDEVIHSKMYHVGWPMSTRLLKIANDHSGQFPE